jgi:hypothetical protein
VNLSQCLAYYGLRATATPTGTNITNDVQIGVGNTSVSLASADVAYSVRAIFAGSGDVLALDLTNGSTSGSTAWVAGTAQVETATVNAAAGITGAGNAQIVITAAGMTGSPKTINVAVTTALNTATLVAGALRTAAAADADVSAILTIGGTGADITATRKPNTVYTVGSETANIYPANDATLNIATQNGTCTGITTAATSANTTPGVATDGVLIYDGDQKDFEGVTIPTISVIRGLLLEGSQEDIDVTVEGSTNDYFTLTSKSVILFALPLSASDGIMDSPYNFTSSGTGDIAITVIGG